MNGIDTHQWCSRSPAGDAHEVDPLRTLSELMRRNSRSAQPDVALHVPARDVGVGAQHAVELDDGAARSSTVRQRERAPAEERAQVLRSAPRDRRA
jgi:hypothetical protein